MSEMYGMFGDVLYGLYGYYGLYGSVCIRDGGRCMYVYYQAVRKLNNLGLHQYISFFLSFFLSFFFFFFFFVFFKKKNKR